MPLSILLTPSFSISYTIRASRRAKSARLKFSPYEGLIVIVPAGFDKKHVPALIESHAEWIRKVQRTFEENRSDDEAMVGQALPKRVELAGIGESWRVVYRDEFFSTPGIRIQETGAAGVELAGAVGDHALSREALERWLKHRASQRLMPQFRDLVEEHGFAVTGLSFRKQRSRWGSCSSKGRISLNLKLLFLPPELVRYIMIHELCHTLHMNHSPRFWEAVERFDPGGLDHDRQMRHAWRYVPAWFAIK